MPKTGLPQLTFEQVHRIRTEARNDREWAAETGLHFQCIQMARQGRTYKNHPTPPYLFPNHKPVGKYATGLPRADQFPTDFVARDVELFERLRHGAEVDSDGCWMWTGSYHSSTRYPSGHHGTTSIKGRRGSIGTHRAMWLAIHGEIPNGMHVLHHCDKPKCVHPDHLWLGTHRDNMADMNRKGRNAMKGRKRAEFGSSAVQS